MHNSADHGWSIGCARASSIWLASCSLLVLCSICVSVARHHDMAVLALPCSGSGRYGAHAHQDCEVANPVPVYARQGSELRHPLRDTKNGRHLPCAIPHACTS
eukprot:6485814-Amphidinium_carterae.1